MVNSTYLDVVIVISFKNKVHLIFEIQPLVKDLMANMPVYLAPLQSYTTVFYRMAFNMVLGGVDKYFTPFFEEGKNKGTEPKLFPEIKPELNRGLYVVPQVATNNPEFLISFASEALKLGYKEINLNMGCPFPMLVKRKKGGGLVGELDMLKVLMEGFFNEKLPIQLSVKMRSGLASPKEGRETIKVLNNYSLNEVIIHPRLVTQKYSGHADWDVFEEMSNEIMHPIVANGDINSIEDLENLKKRFPQVKGLMLGRGLLSNPLILNSAKLSKEMELNLYKEFHTHYKELVLKYCTDWNQAFNHLSNFWYYPLSGSIIGKRQLRKLKKHNTEETYKKWLNDVWSTLFND